MTDLRTAAQQALEALEDDAMQRTFAGGVRISNAALALRAALAEPVQEPVATRALIEECRSALSEELSAWDIDPPLHHVKQAHDKCVAWLAAPPQRPAEPEGGGNLPPPLPAEHYCDTHCTWADHAAGCVRADLSRCTQCGGPADNGHDRSIPPSPYWCTDCTAAAEEAVQGTAEESSGDQP